MTAISSFRPCVRRRRTIFTIAKIADYLLTPSNLIFILVVAGTALLFTRWALSGRSVLGTAAVVFVIAGVTPLPELGVRWLENRIPPPQPLPQQVDGIVVLGGSANAEVLQSRLPQVIADGDSRTLTFLALATQYPAAQLIFSGGTGSLMSDAREADVARRTFEQFRLDDRRIAYERDSRNTRENAVFAFDLAKPTADDRWLLVTSASHMPRALGAFRQAGWATISGVPAGFQARAASAADFRVDILRALFLADLFVHEIVGLAWYRWAGYTNTFVPGP